MAYSIIKEKTGRHGYSEVRGLRNNNPLNIRVGNDWNGEAEPGDETAFEVFESPEWGIRAAWVLMRNYRAKYGIRTIRDLVNRWAPSNENDTSAYVASVAGHTRIAPDEELNEGDYPAVIAAMIKHENGFNPFTLEFIRESMELA